MSQETRSNLTREDIEAAIEAVGYDPLSDHHGFCYVFMDAEEEFGNVAAKFEYGIIGQSQDTLLMRFRETRWFSGVPGELLKACNRWNFEAMFPKACLALDNDGDSLLVLDAQLVEPHRDRLELEVHVVGVGPDEGLGGGGGGRAAEQQGQDDSWDQVLAHGSPPGLLSGGNAHGVPG